MILSTTRLILRAPRLDDLDDMFAIFSDPQVMRYWSTPPHATKAVTAQMLEDRIVSWAAHPLYFQIEHHGRIIGCAGNYRDNEIGFILLAEYWRKGVMTEAMGALLPHLWANTEHAELVADADPANTASVRFLTSLGFHETHRAEKTFFINGVWSDSVYLALSRPPQSQRNPL